MSILHGIRIVLVATLVATLTVAIPPTTASADAGVESQFVASINRERAARGTPALSVASDLTSIARRWSGVMADQGTLYHNPNVFSQVTSYTKAGENVGRGQSASSLHTAFMNSAGHRRNIVDPEFTQVGVGVVVRNGTVWVTQVFRRPTNAPRPAPASSTGSSSSGSSGSGSSAGTSSSGSSSQQSRAAAQRAAEEREAEARRRAEAEERRQAELAANRAAQQRLAELGWYDGDVDGIAGPRTRDAISAFQTASDIEADGVLGAATRDALEADDAVTRAEHEAALAEAARQRRLEAERARQAEQARAALHAAEELEAARRAAALEAERRVEVVRAGLRALREAQVAEVAAQHATLAADAPAPTAGQELVAEVREPAAAPAWHARVRSWFLGLIGSIATS
jgi:hypothetical protein